MEIEVVQDREWTVLTLDGRVDRDTAPHLDTVIKQRVDAGATHLLLDLSRTLYMSSAGLRVLLGTLKTLRTSAGDLQLRDPRENVREVLDMSGFSSLFTIIETPPKP